MLHQVELLSHGKSIFVPRKQKGNAQPQEAQILSVLQLREAILRKN